MITIFSHSEKCQGNWEKPVINSDYSKEWVCNKKAYDSLAGYDFYKDLKKEWEIISFEENSLNERISLKIDSVKSKSRISSQKVIKLLLNWQFKTCNRNSCGGEHYCLSSYLENRNREMNGRGHVMKNQGERYALRVN